MSHGINRNAWPQASTSSQPGGTPRPAISPRSLILPPPVRLLGCSLGREGRRAIFATTHSPGRYLRMDPQSPLQQTPVRGETASYGLWRQMGAMHANCTKLVETSRTGDNFYFFPDRERVSYVTSNGSGDSLVIRSLRSGQAATVFQSSELQKIGDGAWLPGRRYLNSDPCGNSVDRPDAPCNLWIERSWTMLSVTIGLLGTDQYLTAGHALAFQETGVNRARCSSRLHRPCHWASGILFQHQRSHGQQEPCHRIGNMGVPFRTDGGDDGAGKKQGETNCGDGPD